MSLVDMKMSKEESAAETTSQSSDGPVFPFGLCIRLDTDELAKLGFTSDNLPDVGDECHIVAVGCVTSVSEDETMGGYRCALSIQIQMMDLRNEGQEESEESTSEEDAENVSGGTTIIHSTYRGKPGDGDAT